jgi:hypothetical protein
MIDWSDLPMEKSYRVVCSILFFSDIFLRILFLWHFDLPVGYKDMCE